MSLRTREDIQKQLLTKDEMFDILEAFKNARWKENGVYDDELTDFLSTLTLELYDRIELLERQVESILSILPKK